MAVDLTELRKPARPTEPVPARRGSGPARLCARRFLRNRLAVAGVAIFVLLVLFSLFGGLFTPYAYSDADFAALTQAPSATHCADLDEQVAAVNVAAVNRAEKKALQDYAFFPLFSGPSTYSVKKGLANVGATIFFSPFPETIGWQK